jgi:probable F420-dependent oxidoreductase
MSRLPAPVEQEDGADSVLDGPVIADKGDVFGGNAKTLRLNVHHLFLVRNMISSNILYCDRSCCTATPKGRDLKIGATVALGRLNGQPSLLAELGRGLEDRGFESVWLPEHVVLFDHYESAYPFTSDGQVKIPSDTGLLDPFVALTFLAARTSTLRLGTSVCIVPQRNPLYTAKQVADLDVLSQGRVEFGVGLGWSREEYEALQIPWSQRGARMIEHLEVMKTLWTEDISSHQGPHYTLPACRMYPKPVQTPHPPIHVGGNSAAALRRAVEHGQGWYGMNRSPEELPAALCDIRRALDAKGRERTDFTVTFGPPIARVNREMIDAYANLGVDRLTIAMVAGSRDGLLRALDYAAVEMADYAEPTK